jgi:hypothetical protein
VGSKSILVRCASGIFRVTSLGAKRHKPIPVEYKFPWPCAIRQSTSVQNWHIKLAQAIEHQQTMLTHAFAKTGRKDFK